MPVALTYREFGSSGQALLILHGLFGSATNWTSIAHRLAAGGHRVVTADLRNHGSSPHAPGMSYPEMAADVRELLDRLGMAQADVLGHSLGGKVAMRLALETPGRVSRLVVVDIAPVTYHHDFSVILEALRSLEVGGLQRRADADTFLRRRIRDDGVRQFLLQNLVATGQGFRWRLDLDAIERNMSSIVSFPADAGGPYPGETLFLVGELSDYVTRDHRKSITRLFPRAQIRTVPAAGHWLHFEQPQFFLDAIQPFLKR